MEKYDAIIIGAGQAGMPLSMAMVQAGWKTALVEGKHVGGTCINEGCTPTKTMVASAEVAEIARRTAEFGVLTGAVSIDMGRVKARKDEIVDSFRSGDVRRIKKAGVNLIDGQARFSGPKTLEVRLNDGNAVRQLTSEMILINTGGRPSIPRLAGLETVRFLDSTSIMDLEEVPDHLLVLGGGYVALEFGQMFRRFGSQVTLVERSDQLLAQEDADVANAMLGILRCTFGGRKDNFCQTQREHIGHSFTGRNRAFAC